MQTNSAVEQNQTFSESEC